MRKTSYENLELERRGATLVVRLDRPQKLNAFTPALIDELCSLCRDLRKDLETRFVVFTGSGRAFSSGADVSGMGGGGGRIAPEDAARLIRFSRSRPSAPGSAVCARPSCERSSPQCRRYTVWRWWRHDSDGRSNCQCHREYPW